MIYLIFGGDTFRAKKKIQEIVEKYKKVHKSGLNLKILDLKEKSFSAFKEEFRTFSMFAEKKLFVLKNTNKNLNFQEKFLKEIDQFSSSRDLIIFFEEEEILKGKFWDSIKKIAKSAEFKPLNEKKLKIWIKSQFKKYQTEIDNSVVDYLTKTVGNDLWQLDQEIKKLVAFKNQKKINKEEIEKIVSTETAINIFQIIDAIALGKTKEAIFFIKKELEKGEKANFIISMMKLQFKNILLIKDLIEKNIPFYQIKKITGLYPFVVEKCFFLSRRFDLTRLKTIYQNIFEIEIKTRTNRIDAETGLFLLLLQTRQQFRHF